MNSAEQEWKETGDRAQLTLGRIMEQLASGRMTSTQMNSLRVKLMGLRQTLDRIQAGRTVDTYMRTINTNGNGHREEITEEETIPAPRSPHKDRAGGTRRPAGTLHGVPWYDSEDGATWE